MPRSPVVCRLNLIGGFELSCEGSAVDLPETAKRVIAFVALHRKPQARSLVAGSLWPDKPEARAGANLRSALWRLGTPPLPSLVSVDGPLLSLEAPVCVDVRRLQDDGWALLASGSTPRNTAVAHGELAREKDLLFEELLPGWYEDWVLLERERLAELQIHVLDRLVGGLVATGESAAAIDMALRLVALDPYRERSHLALIDAYLGEGSLGRARQHHRTFCELLRTSFGIDYATSFEDLCRRWSQGHATDCEGAQVSARA